MGGMICFVMDACKGGLHRLLEQGLLSCKPLSIPTAGIQYSNSSLLIITTPIMHGMQGQHSRVPMQSPGFQYVMFTL